MKRPNKQKLEQKLLMLRAETITAEVQVFADKCCDWLKLDSNRDKRGTKADAISEAYYACVWFKEAQRALSHEDSSLRHMARKTMKGMLHQNFPEIRKRLGKLHGQISKAGKRKVEQRRQDDERVIELDHRFELRELRSMTSLQKVGRALKNCTAKKNHARNYLRDKDAEMWVLLKKHCPLCLLKVDTTTRTIDEFEGKDRSTPRLKRPLAFKILNALEINGDDEEAFAKIGAFHAFRKAMPAVKTIETEGRQHWIWVLRGGAEIIFATRKRPGARRRWSRFVRGDSETLDHFTLRRRHRSPTVVNDPISEGPYNYLSAEDLLSLMLDHRSLVEILSERAPRNEPGMACRLSTVAGVTKSECKTLPETGRIEKNHA